MARVALINPNYYEEIFRGSKVRAAISAGTTPLGVASLAASLMKGGHDVRIFDLNIVESPEDYLKNRLKEFKPAFVGITSTTPLIKNAYRLASLIKDIDRTIFIMAGGPHPSALPEDVLKESEIDCVVRGEGEFIINRIVEEGPHRSIPNIFYKEKGAIAASDVKHDFITNLDELPYPAYELFDIKSYHQPHISSRREPLGYLESSRGCCFGCVFCNKNIHGYRVRMKSPARVVDEMERMLRLGFKEIHVIDDIFMFDGKRAIAICEEILRRKLKFPWYPRGGARVDKVDRQVLAMMKKAGCYRIPFGIESGSQRILDVINKKITLEQAKRALALTKEVGLETECYFMLGLPTETEEDIKLSIDFAIKLDPDYVKFAITTPLPGTPMFDKILAEGRIKTLEWEKYTFSTLPRELYSHDTLPWDVIEKYLDISYRRFYFRPKYILRMIYKTARSGMLLGHAKAFLNTKWW